MDEIERLLGAVARARDEHAERDALRYLAMWTEDQEITVSLSAYDRSTGRSVSVAAAVAGGGKNLGFEVGFDTDGDYKPDRTYHLCPKSPGNMEVLTRE